MKLLSRPPSGPVADSGSVADAARASHGTSQGVRSWCWACPRAPRAVNKASDYAATRGWRLRTGMGRAHGRSTG